MFQLIRFPPDALPDIRSLAQLSRDQLQVLARLLDTKQAAPPIDQEFEDMVAEELGVDATSAEAIVRISLILQGANIDRGGAVKVVEDFQQLVLIQKPSDMDVLVELISQKRDELIDVISRKPQITRELQRRHIARGTQPAIDSIRTLVQLRPLFQRNEINEPVDIECLIPAMTLELKYKRGTRESSATFSLTEETLDALISSLEDARAKWALLREKFSKEICD